MKQPGLWVSCPAPSRGIVQTTNDRVIALTRTLGWPIRALTSANSRDQVALVQRWYGTKERAPLQ